jgi:hypothetical protein
MIFSLLSGPSLIYAQEKKIMSQIEELQQKMTGPDSLNNILNEVSQMKEEYQNRYGDLPPEVVAIVKGLKNPFVPQLPVEESETATISPPKIDSLTSPSVRINTKQPIDRRPPVEQRQEPNPTFTVTGMVWNSDRPQAIVNGRVVFIGDTVESWTITQINQAGVEVSLQDRKLVFKP